MRVLLVIAFVLLIFAIIVASGTAFLTGWNVWLCGGFAAYILDILLGDRAVYPFTRTVVQ